VTEQHRFILQAYHPEYACPAFDTTFTVERSDQIKNVNALLLEKIEVVAH
jgi:hypothetical protein